MVPIPAEIMKAMVFVMLINLVYIEGAKGSEIAKLRGNQVEIMWGNIGYGDIDRGPRGVQNGAIPLPGWLQASFEVSHLRGGGQL
jgi:hypothetical protein